MAEGGSLLQTGGAGEEVGRRRRLFVQALSLALGVSQFLAVPPNPGRPDETKITLSAMISPSNGWKMWFHGGGGRGGAVKVSLIHHQCEICPQAPLLFLSDCC